MNNPTLILSLVFISNTLAPQTSLQIDLSTLSNLKFQESKYQLNKFDMFSSPIAIFEKSGSQNSVQLNVPGNFNITGYKINLNHKSNYRSFLKHHYKIYTNNSEIKFYIKQDLLLTDTIEHDLTIAKITLDPLLRNENAGIWKKIGRAELFIGGVEIFGMVGLMMMPKEVTKWESDWIKDASNNLVRAFSTSPVWDKDDWQLNYIGHPIAGSYYYNALRSQNASKISSFLFATTQSCIWEYFIEGSAEKPSIQDLIVTPVAGSILGEATHQVTMKMRHNGFNFIEKVFVIIFNPMFAVNNGFGPRYNPVRLRN